MKTARPDMKRSKALMPAEPRGNHDHMTATILVELKVVDSRTHKRSFRKSRYLQRSKRLGPEVRPR